jgi:methylthioribose-1-phosphate isomerase
MRVDGRSWRSIWVAEDGWSVEIIDQTRLPHEFRVLRLATLEEVARAIRDMQVRGAPLIGVAACYGLCLAVRQDAGEGALQAASVLLCQTRPTAINLRLRVEALHRELLTLPPHARAEAAYRHAGRVAEEEVDISRRIAEHGYALLCRLAEQKRAGPVQVLTHCNAGWLATVDWGTALAPLYLAHERGIALHVWVDETRPRSQGYLTAWELAQHGVPHTLVVDNVGGHLMQHGQVDLCIVGTDRTTATGDVCNKIGTYLKALAARDNGVPFYVAAPHSSIDWGVRDGLEEIPIEQRTPQEVHQVTGRTEAGGVLTLRVTPPGVVAANYGFDVTPARLVSGLITERGVCEASTEGLLGLYPEQRR